MPWLNLINQLVGGPSWVSGQELIRRQNNKKNKISGSQPGPIDQGWPRRRKQNKTTLSPLLHRTRGPLASAAVDHANIWGPGRFWAPDTVPNTMAVSAQGPQQEDMTVTSSHGRCFLMSEKCQEETQECYGSSSARKMHVKLFTHGLIWNIVRPRKY